MKLYPVLAFLVCIAPTALSQKFTNLDFENACADSETQHCNWDKAWGSKTAFSVCDGKSGKALQMSNKKRCCELCRTIAAHCEG